MTPSPRRATLLLLAAILTLGAADAQGFRFRTMIVLPAKNETDSARLRVYGIGWQYLLQERLRMLPGLHTPRLGEQPEALAKVLDRQFNVDEVAVRDELAAAYGADLIIAPTMAGDPPDWQLSARLFEPGQAAAVAEIPMVQGRDPAVVSDNVLTEILKEALGLGQVALPANSDNAVDEEDLRRLTSLLYRWPFSEPAQANLPKDGAAAEAANGYIESVTGQPSFSLLVQQGVFSLIAAKQTDEAKRRADLFCGRRRNDARARYIWGLALAAGGDDVGAIAHFEEAVKLSNGAVQAVEALASAHHRRGDGAKALAEYQAACEQWPAVRPLQLARGRLAEELENWSEAFVGYRAAYLAQPTRPDALAGCVRVLLADANYAEAAAYAADLLKLQPDDADAQILAARAAAGAGDHAAARAAAGAVVEREPKNAEAQRILGLAALALEDYEAAEAALDAATKLDDKDLAAWRGLADARLLRDNLDGAAEALASAVKEADGPAQAELRLALARVEYYRGNWDAGIQQIDEALKVVPDDLTAGYLRADLLLYRGDLLPAAEAYLALTERDAGLAGPGAAVLAAHLEAADADGPPALQLAIGILQEAAGRPREARNAYRAFLRGRPADEVTAWVDARLSGLGN